MQRDKEVHRLGLTSVEKLHPDVLIDVVQVGMTSGTRCTESQPGVARHGNVYALQSIRLPFVQLAAKASTAFVAVRSML